MLLLRACLCIPKNYKSIDKNIDGDNTDGKYIHN